MIRKVLYMIFLIVMFSCKKNPYPYLNKEVVASLKLSGRNSVELMKSIARYSHRKDSIKLDMCLWLIKNMKYHTHKTYLLFDSTKKAIDYNISDFDNLYEARNYKDSISKVRGELRFYRHFNGLDLYKIKGQCIINQVEDAFANKYVDILNDTVAYNMVKKYVLPYRLNDSEISLWKQYFNKRYDYLDCSYDSIIEKITQDVWDMMEYDSCYIENPTDQNLEKIITNKKGRSEDAAVLLAMALRSQGIPATIDYVPLPQEEEGKLCYWDIVWDKELIKKSVIPVKDLLEEYDNPFKVFRRSYTKINNALPNDTIYNDIRYMHFLDGCFEDVTNEYHDVTSIIVNDFAYRDALQPVFLEVNYNGKWFIIDWKYPEKEMIFNNITRGYDYAIFNSAGEIMQRVEEVQ